MDPNPEHPSSARRAQPSGNAWFRDPWFSVGFFLWIVTVVMTALPILSPEVRSRFSDLWADFTTLPFTILIAAWLVRRSESSNERKFWLFFLVALSAWLGVRVMYLAVPSDWGIHHDVATDVMYGTFYLMLALALEMRPHTRPSHAASVRPRDEGIPILTTIIFFAATVVYFIVLPSREQPEAYRFWGYSFGLYVVLDLYLCGRLLSISHRGRDRWSNVYRWLMITFVLWAMTDAVEGALYAGFVPWIEPGSLIEVVWYLPSLTLIIALRSRWWSEPDGRSR
jgi:hypothetical protein